MVARPGGRAGGGGAGPPRGGPPPPPGGAARGGGGGGGGSAPPAGRAPSRGSPRMARRFNPKPPTEEERDARRKADRERIEQAARELLTTEGWQRWIKVRASNGLSRYSVSNQMLIALDCWSRGITPTYVAGFRAFLDLNRSVR